MIAEKGIELFEKEDYENALKHFEQLLIEKPENKTHIKYKVLSLIKLNRLEEALTIQSEITKNSENPGNWEILGKILFEMEKYDEALNAYDRAIEKKPSDENWFNEHAIYIKMGKLEDALFCIEKSLWISPENVEFLGAKVSILNKLKRVQDEKTVQRKISETKFTFVKKKQRRLGIGWKYLKSRCLIKTMRLKN